MPLREAEMSAMEEFRQTLQRGLDPEPVSLDDLGPQWRDLRRETQTPPDGRGWVVWLIKAGRGFGKTRTGAETIVDWVADQQLKKPCIVGATWRDVRLVMVEGEVGLQAASFNKGMPARWNSSTGQIRWDNGAIATCYSAEKPGRLRGPSHDGGWGDEIREWYVGKPTAGGMGNEAWDNMIICIRIGEHPRVIATTTPRPLSWLKKLEKLATTVITRGTTYENLDNLSPVYRSQVVAPMEGTRIGRQELDAEDLEDAEGALWTRDMIEENRIWELPTRRRQQSDGTYLDEPDIVRGVVSIDPAVTAAASSDETGITGGVRCGNGWIVLVHDWSGRFKPRAWAKRGVELFDELEADRMLGEVNNGGDMVEEMVRTVRPGISFKQIRASKGKHIRAEPIASRYEKGDVKHLGSFPVLEDQLCNMTVDGYVGDGSPDRADSWVYAVTELAGSSGRIKLVALG